MVLIPSESGSVQAINFAKRLFLAHCERDHLIEFWSHITGGGESLVAKNPVDLFAISLSNLPYLRFLCLTRNIVDVLARSYINRYRLHPLPPFLAPSSYFR